MTELLAQALMLWYRFIDWINSPTDFLIDPEYQLIHEHVPEEEDDYETYVAQDYSA